MPDPKIIQFPLGLRENLQYHFVEVPVVSGEILALNSAPKILVAAPGAGKILMPINSITKLSHGTVVYGANTDLKIVHNGLIIQLLGLQSIIGQASDWIGFDALISQSYSALTSENKSLDLYCDTGDPTGGDGTLTIYLWYINLEL